ncbi:GNAT family N-acetyltransferase [Acetobacterium sp.]|uniref:GNAT family N-acetyltransferase n=1 Tax=Acetobacterium sp. TaxID=1872094 RepID=UPI00359338EC
MNITIRNEEEKDYRKVEEVTREGFWNHFQPGADEHFLLHNLRKSPDFIKELDFVIEADGEIIGSIIFSTARIIDATGIATEVITFGPLTILPDYQKQGLGRKLIQHAIHIATEMGFKAILIYGDPRFYGRLGFRAAEKYDITTADGYYAIGLLAYVLQPGALQKISGRFEESPVYHQIDQTALEAFDSNFEKKQRCETEFQKEFRILLSLVYKAEQEK